MLPPPTNLIPFPEEGLEELRVPHLKLDTEVGPAPEAHTPYHPPPHHITTPPPGLLLVKRQLPLRPLADQMRNCRKLPVARVC